MIGQIRHAVSVMLSISAIASFALSPCSYLEFYDKVDYSPDIQPGVWSGRSDLCLKKARETGWLMLWFIAAREDKQNCYDFLRSNLCNQPFCDVVNNYKYLILCYEDYSGSSGRNLKDSIYGYPEPKKILDENTGEMVENHRGYPIKTIVGWDAKGEAIIGWCDYPPSLHLIKIDASTNIIFHVCKREGVYDSWFSPYAEKFPIPSNMNVSMNLFAPWLKQYLDMYPVAEQIEEYEDTQTVTVDVEKTVTEYVTNMVYQAKTIAVTETINPTVYQMALHRDNLLFRAVTMLGDIMVDSRIHDDFDDFDGRISLRNADGKWYINHDKTMSSVISSGSDYSSIDLLARETCELSLCQRFGNGFSINGYVPTFETNVNTQQVFAANGETVSVVTTNTILNLETKFMECNVGRHVMFSTNLLSGRIYRVTTTGNATFDVFSTK